MCCVVHPQVTRTRLCSRLACPTAPAASTLQLSFAALTYRFNTSPHRVMTLQCNAQVAEKAAKGAGLGSSRYPPGSRGSQQEPAAAKVEPPNALVAYREEGLEAVDISTGQTICQLHLPAGGLHADLDADGVPDHVQVRAQMPHVLVGSSKGGSCTFVFTLKLLSRVDGVRRAWHNHAPCSVSSVPLCTRDEALQAVDSTLAVCCASIAHADFSACGSSRYTSRCVSLPQHVSCA